MVCLSRSLWIVLVCALCCLGACSDADFDAVSRIQKVRVIGLLGDPPGVAPGETVHFSPVIAKPVDADGGDSVHWQICLFPMGPGNFYACPDSIPQLPVDNLLAEGSGTTFTYTQDQVSDALLHTACETLYARAASIDAPAAAMASIPSCRLGINTTVRVKLCKNAPDCEDKDAIIVVKSMPLLFSNVAERSDRNTNPRIHDVFIDGQKLEEGTPLTLSIDSKKRDWEISIDASAAESAQEFTIAPAQIGDVENAPKDDIAGTAAREQLETDWYVTAGTWKWDRRYFRADKTTDTEFKTNTLTLDPASLQDGQHIELWVVMRDTRLGSMAVHREIIIKKQ